MTRTRWTILVSCSAAVVAALTPGPASGIAPQRPCPENFPDIILRADTVPIDNGVLFDRVNKNGDGIICIRWYANKEGGVLKDNTANGPAS